MQASSSRWIGIENMDIIVCRIQVINEVKEKWMRLISHNLMSITPRLMGTVKRLAAAPLEMSLAVPYMNVKRNRKHATSFRTLKIVLRIAFVSVKSTVWALYVHFLPKDGKADSPCQFVWCHRAKLVFYIIVYCWSAIAFRSDGQAVRLAKSWLSLQSDRRDYDEWEWWRNSLKNVALFQSLQCTIYFIQESECGSVTYDSRPYFIVFSHSGDTISLCYTTKPKTWIKEAKYFRYLKVLRGS